MANTKTTKTKTKAETKEVQIEKATDVHVEEVNDVVHVEPVVESIPTTLKVAKRKLDPDTEIDVMSNFAGELIYISPKTSEMIKWPTLGEIAPMTVDELNTMKNTNRKFFERGWVKPVGEFSNEAIAQLRLGSYYTDFVDVSKLKKLFGLSKSDIIKYVANTKPAIRDTIAISIQSMIENGELVDLSVIRAFEEAIGYKLLEN